jgi:hypothetical protein
MNRGSDSILSVYSDARAEYTKQLCVFLVPAYFQFFIELLERAKEATVQEPKRALWQFQNYLNEVHDWNMEKVNHEIHNIHTNSGCDYLDDLLTAVFIAHTKVLTAIRLSANKKKIEINVPKVEHFLFKVLCETSKLLWSSSYLFRDGISAIEKQQNYRSIEQLINEGILQAIRSLVPVKSILKDFVNNDFAEGGEEEDSDSEDEKEVEEPKEKQTEEPKEEAKETLFTLPESQPESQPESTIALESTLPSIHVEEPISIPEPSIPEVTSVNHEVPAVPEETTTVPPTIIIDDKPGVKFSEFDAVFDSDHPENSDLVYYPKDGIEDGVPDLEILDDSGTPLSEDIDFDSLDKKEEPTDISSLDYEELN